MNKNIIIFMLSALVSISPVEAIEGTSSVSQYVTCDPDVKKDLLSVSQNGFTKAISEKTLAPSLGIDGYTCNTDILKDRLGGIIDIPSFDDIINTINKGACNKIQNLADIYLNDPATAYLNTARRSVNGEVNSVTKSIYEYSNPENWSLGSVGNGYSKKAGSKSGGNSNSNSSSSGVSPYVPGPSAGRPSLPPGTSIYDYIYNPKRNNGVN